MKFKNILLFIICLSTLIFVTQSCKKNTEPTGANDVVTIEGHVYDCSIEYNIPIKDAVIGTSLDFITTTTDASGYFFLKTNTLANYSSTTYTININSPGFKTGGGTWGWGDHPCNQVFCLYHL